MFYVLIQKKDKKDNKRKIKICKTKLFLTYIFHRSYMIKRLRLKIIIMVYLNLGMMEIFVNKLSFIYKVHLGDILVKLMSF